MPTISSLESKVKRLQSEITRLEDKKGKALKNESDALKKISSAQKTISTTKNITTINNKLKEIERENKKIQKAREEQSKAISDFSKKSSELNKATIDLGKEQQKKQSNLYKEQEQKIKQLYEEQAASLAEITNDTFDVDEPQKEYDIFISHSADDKDSYVSLLAEALKAEQVSIWYDSDNIGWGQSIRAEIDKGLRNSKYGIVVISPTFIQKYWTQYELDGILNKESSTGKQMILPIWHNVTADQVKEYSYSLSGKLALNTAINTIEEIVEKVKALIK